MNITHYHVFLSYRRKTGEEYARMLQLALENRGYTVFFDHDALQDGNYKEMIKSAIAGCDVFLLAYSEKSLDGCADPEDVLRQEIEVAIRHGKKIIPVASSKTLEAWEFPANLPGSLGRELPLSQISCISAGKQFNMAVAEMIANRFPVRLRRQLAHRPPSTSPWSPRHGGDRRCRFTA